VLFSRYVRSLTLKFEPGFIGSLVIIASCCMIGIASRSSIKSSCLHPNSFSSADSSGPNSRGGRDSHSSLNDGDHKVVSMVFTAIGRKDSTSDVPQVDQRALMLTSSGL